MTRQSYMLPIILLSGFSTYAVHAEVPIDVVAGSEVGFEGLLQADGNWFHNDRAELDGDVQDGSNNDFELRRAELVLKGKGPGKLEWVVGYDAKADKWLDTNLKYKIGGNGHHYLQLGQFKQPNSLEELSSTRNNDFISKAAITNTWSIGRRVGMAYGLGGSDWSLSATYFDDELKRGNGAGGGVGLRGTWAPVNQARNILHLGLSHLHYNAELAALNGGNNTSAQRWRVRPQADLAGVRLIDTGTLEMADKVSTSGIEAFWVKGPIKLQGEYMRSTTSREGGFKDFTGSGAYLSAIWNITGETWSYKAGTPATDLPREPGRGLWQVGLRYDSIDLNDGSMDLAGAEPIVDGVLGGEMDAWTLGVNWYLRSNFKLSANYVMVSSSKYSSSADAILADDPSIFELRTQFHW